MIVLPSLKVVRLSDLRDNDVRNGSALADSMTSARRTFSGRSDLKPVLSAGPTGTVSTSWARKL